MKKLFLLAIVSMMFIGVNVVNAQVSTRSVKEKSSNEAVYSVKVDFHCPNGKDVLERELIKRHGITKVVANLDTKIIYVTYDNKFTKPENIVKAIHEIGYLTADSPKGTVLEKKACSHK